MGVCYAVEAADRMVSATFGILTSSAVGRQSRSRFGVASELWMERVVAEEFTDAVRFFNERIGLQT